MPDTKAAEEEPAGPFDIYETREGPRHVGNAVRRRILSRMRGRELTFPEIVEVTGLTKSTVSTHLAMLHRQHMVEYREDPKDRRKKRYYLVARHVATAQGCRDRGAVATPAEEAPLAAGAQVPRLLLRALVAEFACCGLDMAPVVQETGRRVGEMVGRQHLTDDVAAWAVRAERFWADSGLGRLRVIHDDGPSAGDIAAATVEANGPGAVAPPTGKARTDDGPRRVELVVEDCGLCCQAGGPRVGLCDIAAGILEGMASESMRTMAEVRSIETPDDGLRAAAGPSHPPANDATEPAVADDARVHTTAPTARPCGCRFAMTLPAPTPQ